MAHPELGSRILDAVLEQLGTTAKVETQARLEGRNMTMVLAPEKKAIPKKADKPERAEKDDHKPSSDTHSETDMFGADQHITLADTDIPSDETPSETA